jgi:hypothetical protein
MSEVTRRHEVQYAHRAILSSGKTGSTAENYVERIMTIDNRSSPEIPPVCPGQIVMALALFRAAALDETVEETILPLSDRGIWKALLEPDALQRAIGVIRIHFESSNSIHPVVQRVACFLQLLREQNQNPNLLWLDIMASHNRFIPIINAIAWCTAHTDKAFDIVLFAKIASHTTNDVNGHLSLVTCQLVVEQHRTSLFVLRVERGKLHPFSKNCIPLFEGRHVS